ncbi:MAG: S9 family peptidase, partial [Bacteroidales bacterium]|nr:S9 family peptidase [Bacteroidales bacterium]
MGTKKLHLISAAILSLALLNSCETKVNIPIVEYPATAKCDTIDTYFGVQVADPYRWLENDTSEATINWVKSQNEVTDTFFSKIPYRQAIKDRLDELMDYPKETAPWKKGNRYFYFYNEGLQNQYVLYYKNSLLDDKGIELLNTNKLFSDGSKFLSAFEISGDGKYLAYSISDKGSDWQEIFIKDIESGNNLKDHLKWIK